MSYKTGDLAKCSYCGIVLEYREDSEFKWRPKYESSYRCRNCGKFTYTAREASLPKNYCSVCQHSGALDMDHSCRPDMGPPQPIDEWVMSYHYKGRL